MYNIIMNTPHSHDNLPPHSHAHDKMSISSIYYTASGPVEIPDPPISASEYMKIHETDMVTTRDSNLAPLWLVFPTLIVNTQNICCLSKTTNKVHITMKDGNEYVVNPKDINQTWESLQNAFADGL